MSHTITLTYCKICDLVDNAFNTVINTFEAIGRARAASQLSAMGYHEAAKALMLGEDTTDVK